MQTVQALLVAAALASASPAPAPATAPLAESTTSTQRALETYAELAFRSYGAAQRAATDLQKSVDDFLTAPPDERDEALAVTRQAWIDAHAVYGRSEAFRFYEGPIDFGKRTDGTMGPEALINSWPVNEAYIDSVRADPASGLINAKDVPITRAMLIERNARDDEADVTTGFHAIEFLLWGEDTRADGPGNRSARDFAGDGVGARRREYLKVATDLLVENLATVVAAWRPDSDNYRAQFLRLDPRESIAKILTGLATLSGFELGFERLATALDSGSQEDEQSCFSDTTDADIRADAQSVADVYFGRYDDYHGTGLDTLLEAVNPQMNAVLKSQLKRSVALAAEIPHPFDRILMTSPGSAERAKVEALVTSLQTQARLIKQSGRMLGVNVVVDVEYD